MEHMFGEKYEIKIKKKDRLEAILFSLIVSEFI